MKVIYQVYLDSYFVLNVWMNLLVLFLCRFFLKKKVGAGRLLGASTVAAIIQCGLLFLPAGGGQIKRFLGFGGVMTLVIHLFFRPKGKRAYVKIFFALCSSSFFLAGGMKAAGSFLGIREADLFEIAVLGLVCTLGFCFAFFEFWGTKTEPFVRVKLQLAKGLELTCLALVDSGNSLQEPVSRKPVSLIEQRVLTGKEEGLLPNRFRIIPFHSIGQPEGLLEAYWIEKMEVEKDGEWLTVEQPFIGVVKDRISGQKGYQMILHPAILENRRNDQ